MGEARWTRQILVKTVEYGTYYIFRDCFSTLHLLWLEGMSNPARTGDAFAPGSIILNTRSLKSYVALLLGSALQVAGEPSAPMDESPPVVHH